MNQTVIRARKHQAEEVQQALLHLRTAGATGILIEATETCSQCGQPSRLVTLNGGGPCIGCTLGYEEEL